MFGLDVKELLLLGVVAVMLFGRRLPEVARSIGQTYNQFRKGLNDLKREMDHVVYTTKSEINSATTQLLTYDDDELKHPTVPAFQPIPASARPVTDSDPIGSGTSPDSATPIASSVDNPAGD